MKFKISTINVIQLEQSLEGNMWYLIFMLENKKGHTIIT